MSNGTAALRIERFLADHPHGDLLVAVGYATPAGVAWMARRTQGRRVSLLIGDARQEWWKQASDADRRDCLAFLNSPDVEVRNWYRTKRSRHGEASAHLKVWVAHDDWGPRSALVGSGNLTRKGLEGNVEVMVEARDQDRRQTWETVQELWEKAWPCADRLIGYLDGLQAPVGARRSPSHPLRPRADASQETRSAARVSTPAETAPAVSGNAPTPTPAPMPAPGRGGTASLYRFRVAAGAGLLMAMTGAGVPVISVLRRGWGDAVVWLEFLIGALCLGSGLWLGWWARDRSEGACKALAAAAIASAALGMAAMVVAMVVAAVIWALPAIKIFVAVLVLLPLAVLADRLGLFRR